MQKFYCLYSIRNPILYKTLKYGIVCVFLTSLCSIAQAQTVISEPVINLYSAVTGINAGSRTVIVENAIFKARDTVMLIQMTGLSADGNTLGGAGKYEFHIVSSVTGQNVVLNGAVDANFAPSDESVQLIRVPSYKNARVTQVLKCTQWNGKTGGVLALMVEGTLTLDADIDVSGLGFQGGGESGSPYPTQCGSSFSNPNYGTAASGQAGYKGQGAMFRTPQTTNTRGFAATYNGGGGGNGMWSGGGGGANGGAGGSGDIQVCEDTGNYSETFGAGGSAIRYNDAGEAWKQRAFLGGGGGSGTSGGTGTGEKNTPGGNGGGIVIIVAGTIQFNNGAGIKANGSSVVNPNGANSGVVAAGAGGGGAGGSVLLSAWNYGAGLKVDINGGTGGNADRGTCTDNTRSRGAGGGGGGGLIYVPGNAADFRAKYNPTFNINAGAAGRIITTGAQCIQIATSGGTGYILGGLIVQLKGFLYNFITTPNDTTVCYGTTPTIKASQPQGGYTLPYTYEWQRFVGGAWTAVPNSNVQNLTTPPITAPTAFRRIVRSTDASGNTIADQSAQVDVNVVPEIKNTLAVSDTSVCGNVENINIKGRTPTGGNGTYSYQWEQNLNNAGWQTIGGAAGQNLTNATLTSDPVNATEQDFRRKVTSQGCTVTSDPAKVHILPVIQGNNLGSDQRLCETASAVTLGNTTLSGGDNVSYRYLWQKSDDNKAWADISGAAALTYQPPKDIGNMHYYRRIVSSGRAVSGSYDCCFDTSKPPVSLLYDKLPSPAEAGEDQTLDYQFSAKLNAQVPASGTGKWSAVAGDFTFADPAQASTTVSNLAPGENTVQWKVSNGVCPADSDQLVIRVKDITRYSGFSPNGDGVNDCFQIDGAQNAESGELIIFNRYNNVVYRSTSFSKDDSGCVWDGRNSSGKDLPAGTYYYQLTLNGDKVYKGYVVLKK